MRKTKKKKREQYETNVYELQQKIYYQIKFLTGDIALSVRFSRSLVSSSFSFWTEFAIDTTWLFSTCYHIAHT